MIQKLQVIHQFDHQLKCYPSMLKLQQGNNFYFDVIFEMVEMS